MLIRGFVLADSLSNQSIFGRQDYTLLGASVQEIFQFPSPHQTWHTSRRSTSSTLFHFPHDGIGAIDHQISTKKNLQHGYESYDEVSQIDPCKRLTFAYGELVFHDFILGTLIGNVFESTDLK